MGATGAATATAGTNWAKAQGSPHNHQRPPLAVSDGAPWRDLPERFGPWNSVFVRFRRWTRVGAWERAFAALASDPLWEWTVVDTTIVRAHQHAAGAKGRAQAQPSAGPEAA
jgi:putative transposase